MNTNAIKKHLSLLVILALCISLMNTSITQGKSKPRLSKSTIVLNKFDCKDVSIKGVKSSTISKITAKTTNKSIATVNEGDSFIMVIAQGPGECKIKVTVSLKKKVSGKKKYHLSLKVKVNTSDTPTAAPTAAPTFAPTAVPTFVPTTAPTPAPTTAPTSGFKLDIPTEPTIVYYGVTNTLFCKTEVSQVSYTVEDDRVNLSAVLNCLEQDPRFSTISAYFDIVDDTGVAVYSFDFIVSGTVGDKKKATQVLFYKLTGLDKNGHYKLKLVNNGYNPDTAVSTPTPISSSAPASTTAPSGSPSSSVDGIVNYLNNYSGKKISDVYGSSSYSGASWEEYDNYYGRNITIFIGCNSENKKILFKYRESQKINESFAQGTLDNKVYMVYDASTPNSTVVGFDYLSESKMSSPTMSYIFESYDAEGTINPATHTDEEEFSLNVSFTNFSGVTEEKFNEWVPKQSYSSFKTALHKFKDYLSNKMNVAIKDLGFVNY